MQWGGDRSRVPAKYHDPARKLLGELKNRLAVGGVASGSMRRVLPDGAIIEASWAGEQPMVRVTPPESSSEPPKVRVPAILEGIVVNARSAALFTGIRTGGHGQQVIAPSGNVYTYDREGLAAGVVSDGVYGPTFPDGIEHAGNVDWTDGKGLWINWYGPTLRYWFDTYRAPGAQYGPYVFINGAVLLDIGAYATANQITIAEQLVLGAALVGDKLYVMQARINAFPAMAADDYVPSTGGEQHAWISSPYPPGTTDLRLCRYTVASNPAATGNATLLSIFSGSMVSLWTDTRRGTVNPWVFNHEATVLETFAMPDELRYLKHVIKPTIDGGFPDGKTTVHRSPSASSEHITLTRSGDAVTASVTDVSIALNGLVTESRSDRAPIAADYSLDGTRSVLYAAYEQVYLGQHPTDGYDMNALRFGLQIDEGLVVPLDGNNTWSGAETAATFPRYGAFAHLREVCIRDDRIALQEQRYYYVSFDNYTEPYEGMRVALYKGGVLESSEYFAHDTANGGDILFSHAGGDTYMPWTLTSGLRSWFDVAAPTLKQVRSPMVALFGMEADSTTEYYYSSTAGGYQWEGLASDWQGGVLTNGGVRFHDDEVEGSWCGWHGGNRQGFGTSFSYGQTVNGYTDSSSPQEDVALDLKSRRIYASGSSAKDGSQLSSFSFIAVFRNNDGRYPKLLSSRLISNGDLSTVTGVQAGPGPVNQYTGTSEFAHDARFSTIWRLGKYPEI